MRLFLLICAAVALVHAGDDDADVVELTDSDFDERMKDYDIALVEFFAPWCGHCKRLKPEYADAATILKDNDPPVPLVKVDCTENKAVCEKHGVSGYPTLKIFKKGEFSADYNGPREKDGIVKYMSSKAGPSSKHLQTVDDALSFIKKAKDTVIIGFFQKEDSDLQKKFQKAADKLSEDYKFAHSTDKDINKKLKHKDEIVVYRPTFMKNKFEDLEVVYKSGEIPQFVEANVFGLCGHRKSGNQGHFKNPLVVAYYDVDYTLNVKGTNYWRNRVMKVGKKFAGKNVNFAISNPSDFFSEISEFGATAPEKGQPPIVLAKGAKGEKYKMEDEFSMDNLEKFVQNLLDGKLEPYLKSEPVPEDNDAPVKVVVAKNFKEIVDDPTKDVLIEFYAPWCGHCKSLEPKYNELAEKLKDETNIVIAKMDATANDVPPAYNVRGFPTIYFSPAGSKSEPKQYSGSREVDDFVKYLAKEATDELKGFNRKGKAKKSEL
ncbi:protein disulfide-isomerase A3-like [Tubulanus polymorphus]|uniref:protein disulfide-isomerase A3-like n=1 Tax=Tubulanus polymorphus TaxID=672921 RepID=UPI003DA60991